MVFIGIDLDNTIVQYDQIIHDVAVKRGLIPIQTSVNKTIIRDIFRSSGRESEWTGIQGYIYGEGMRFARPFPGVIQFIRQLSLCGFSPCIISHRSQVPYSGGGINLHQTAFDWLFKEGIVGNYHAPVPHDQVFFELTKEEKYQRIISKKCIVFIDDLIEFLMSDLFPKGVKPVLFDPYDNYPDSTVYIRIKSWNDAAYEILKI